MLLLFLGIFFVIEKFSLASCQYVGHVGHTLMTNTDLWPNAFNLLVTTIIAQNGQVGYLAAMQSGYYYIFEYNITTPTPTLRGTFDNNGILIDPDRMEVSNQHLFLYSKMSTSVHYYSLTTRIRLGTFTLSDSAREMRYLPSRNQMMFVTNTTGFIRLVPLNNFPPNHSTVIINVNSSPL